MSGRRVEIRATTLTGDLMVDCYPRGDHRVRRATPTERLASRDAGAEGWIITRVSTLTIRHELVAGRGSDALTPVKVCQ